jgi:hypothetical protein
MSERCRARPLTELVSLAPSAAPSSTKQWLRGLVFLGQRVRRRYLSTVLHDHPRHTAIANTSNRSTATTIQSRVCCVGGGACGVSVTGVPQG